MSLSSPVLGPDAAIRLRWTSLGGGYTSIDAAVGRSNARFVMPEDRRTRPSAGGAYNSVRLGWTNGSLSFTCDDAETTHWLFSTAGARVDIQVDPVNSNAGSPRFEGVGLITCTPAVNQAGRTLTVAIAQHGDWTESVIA